MNQNARLDYLIDYLLKESHESTEPINSNVYTYKDKITLFQKLCNMRSPEPVSDSFISVQNAFLTVWNHERRITMPKELKAVQPQIYLWQGDITSLAADTIVNAANSDLLGCHIANHHCIDNIIHTRAGVQLRSDCHELIKAQGRKEAAGKAKITYAYNLPADYVIHTVGPYIDHRGVSPLKERLLASSYQSCLELADKYQLETIAFCCISSGEFNFPKQQAAEIAVNTVKRYISSTQSKLHVIFNVFNDEDLEIYKTLLQSND